jgi:glucosamine--fructose-6-phosphate aminotransferase (isomerizing)
MSHLYDEIHEQPQVIDRLIHNEQDSVAQIAGELRRRPIRHILIAARGTSDNAATYGKYLFGSILRLPVALAAPSLYTIYHTPPRTGAEVLVIGISQSGESPDIVAVVEEARHHGASTVAITNELDSPLARAAEYGIACEAGADRKSQLQLLPQAVEKTLALDDVVHAGVERYRYAETAFVLGRGYNYATAFEIALKLKELSYILIEAYSSADFLHGPIAVIEHGFPAILIAPSSEVYPDMLAVAKELCDKGAELIVISDRREALELAVTPLQMPVTVPEWLSPIVCVIPGQLFAHYLTLAKGYDPDHPRGLRKVTLTR